MRKKFPSGENILFYVKNCKTYKLSFRCTILSQDCLWNQAVCLKYQIQCKLTFSHKNTTFIETFAMGFISKLKFPGSTVMITYFVTDTD